MRLLICGDRDWTDEALMREIIDKYDDFQLECIIEGEARGADRIAAGIAYEKKIPIKRFPADWLKYGRAAGPIRNKKMLDQGNPDLVIAFHDDLDNSKGTKNMVDQSLKRGLSVVHVSHAKTTVIPCKENAQMRLA